MNRGTNGGAEKGIVSPVAAGIIMLIGASTSAALLQTGGLLGILLMTVASAALALLICMRAVVMCCVLCPISVALGSVIITVMGGGLESVILFCSFIAIGGVLALCVSKASDRTGTVVAMSFALAVMLIGALLAEYFAGGGEFSAEGLKTFIEGKTDALRSVIAEAYKNYMDAVANASAGVKIDAADLNAAAESTATAFIAILPGTLIASLQIICYIVTCWFTFFARKMRCEVILPSPRWELYPTMVTVIIFAVSSVVFAGAYVVALISSSGSVVGTVAYNLNLITMPAFFAIGFSAVFGKKAAGRRGMAAFIFVVFAIVALQLAFMTIAIIGAIGVFVRRKAESADKDGGSGGDE